MNQIKRSFLNRIVTFQVIICFTFSVFFIDLKNVYALPAAVPNKSLLTEEFMPNIVLKGIRVDARQPLDLKFMFEQPKTEIAGLQERDVQRQVNYFTSGLAIPEKDWWVNLSVYEQNKMIPQAFGASQLGRDVLADDYVLKVFTSNFFSPHHPLGRQFWQRVYAASREKYQQDSLPLNSLNKVWIVPKEVVINEHLSIDSPSAITAIVERCVIGVMIDKDYKARSKNKMADDLLRQEQLVKDIMIPVIEQEVNHGKRFVRLRQAISALALASWYKKRTGQTLLNESFTDQRITQGLVNNGQLPQHTFRQYVEAFKQGVVNEIVTTVDDQTGNEVTKKYFAGGVSLAKGADGLSDLAMANVKLVSHGVELSTEPKLNNYIQVDVGVHLNPAMTSFTSAREWMDYVQDQMDMILNPVEFQINENALEEVNNILNEMTTKSEIIRRIGEDLKNRMHEFILKIRQVNADIDHFRQIPTIDDNYINYFIANHGGLDNYQKLISALRQMQIIQEQHITKKARHLMKLSSEVRGAIISYQHFLFAQQNFKGMVYAVALKHINPATQDDVQSLARGYTPYTFKDVWEEVRSTPAGEAFEKLFNTQVNQDVVNPGITKSDEIKKEDAGSGNDKFQLFFKRGFVTATAVLAGIFMPIFTTSRYDESVDVRLIQAEMIEANTRLNAQETSTPPDTKQDELLSLNFLNNDSTNSLPSVVRSLMPKRHSFIKRKINSENKRLTAKQSISDERLREAIMIQESDSKKDQYFKNKLNKINEEINLPQLKKDVLSENYSKGPKFFATEVLAKYLLAVVEEMVTSELEEDVLKFARHLDPQIAQEIKSLTSILKQDDIEEEELLMSILKIKDLFILQKVFLIPSNYLKKERPHVFIMALDVLEQKDFNKEHSLVFSKGKIDDITTKILIIDDSSYIFKDHVRGYYDGKYIVVYNQEGIDKEVVGISNQYVMFHEMMHRVEEELFKRFHQEKLPNGEINALLAPMLVADNPLNYYNNLAPYRDSYKRNNIYSHAVSLIDEALKKYLATIQYAGDLQDWLKNSTPAKIRQGALVVYDHPEWFGNEFGPYVDDIDHGQEMKLGVDGSPPSLKFNDGDPEPPVPIKLMEPLLRATFLQNQELIKDDLTQLENKLETINDAKEWLSKFKNIKINQMNYQQLNGVLQFIVDMSTQLDKRFPTLKSSRDVVFNQIIDRIEAYANEQGWQLYTPSFKGPAQALPADFKWFQTPVNGVEIYKNTNNVYRVVGPRVSARDVQESYTEAKLVFAKGQHWLMSVMKMDGRMTLIGSLSDKLRNMVDSMDIENIFNGFSINSEVTILVKGDSELKKYRVISINASNELELSEEGKEASINLTPERSTKYVSLFRTSTGEVREVNVRIPIEQSDSDIQTLQTDFYHPVLMGDLAHEAKMEGVKVFAQSKVLVNGKSWMQTGIIQVDDKHDEHVIYGNDINPIKFSRAYLPTRSNIVDVANSREGYNDIKLIWHKGSEWVAEGNFATITNGVVNYNQRILGPAVPEELKNKDVNILAKVMKGDDQYLIVVESASDLWFLSSVNSKHVKVLRDGWATGKDAFINSQGQWLSIVGTDRKLQVIGPLAKEIGIEGNIYQWVELLHDNRDGYALILKTSDDHYTAVGSLVNSLRFKKFIREGNEIKLDTTSVPMVGQFFEGMQGHMVNNELFLQVMGKWDTYQVIGPKQEGEIFTIRGVQEKKGNLILGFDGTHAWRYVLGSKEVQRLSTADYMSLDSTTGLVISQNAGQWIDPFGHHIGSLPKESYFENSINGLNLSITQTRLALQGSTPTIAKDSMTVKLTESLMATTNKQEKIKAVIDALKDQPPVLDDLILFQRLLKEQASGLSEVLAQSTPDKVITFMSFMLQSGYYQETFKLLRTLKESSRVSPEFFKVVTLGVPSSLWLKMVDDIHDKQFPLLEKTLFDVQVTADDLKNPAYKVLQALRLNLPIFKVGHDLKNLNEYQVQRQQFQELNQQLNQYLYPLGNMSISLRDIKDLIANELSHDALVIAMVIGMLNVIAGLIVDQLRRFDKVGLSADEVKRHIFENNSWLNEQQFEQLLYSREILRKAFAVLNDNKLTTANIQEIWDVRELLRFDQDGEGKEAILTALLVLPTPTGNSSESWRIRILRAVPFIGVLWVNLFYKGPDNYIDRQKMLGEINDLFTKGLSDKPQITPADVILVLKDIVRRFSRNQEKWIMSLKMDADLFEDVIKRSVQVIQNQDQLRTRERFIPAVLPNGSRTSRRGNGADFKELRAYQDGDQPKDIDWNSWARSGGDPKALMVRTYHEDARIGFNLLINVNTLTSSKNFQQDVGPWLSELWQNVKFLFKKYRYQGAQNYYLEQVDIVDHEGKIQHIPLDVREMKNPQQLFNHILKKLEKYFKFRSEGVKLNDFNLRFYSTSSIHENAYHNQLYATQISEPHDPRNRLYRNPLEDFKPGRLLLTVGFPLRLSLELNQLALKNPRSTILTAVNNQIIRVRSNPAMMSVELRRSQKGGVDLTQSHLWVKTDRRYSKDSPIKSRGNVSRIWTTIHAIKPITPAGFMPAAG